MKRTAGMKKITGLVLGFATLISCASHAESLRCKGDIIDIGDTKIDVLRKCGEPEFKDTFCENTPVRIRQSDNQFNIIERCENIDIWTYNPGKGQFWTNLYFSEGKLREMRYGDRVK